MLNWKGSSHDLFLSYSQHVPGKMEEKSVHACAHAQNPSG